MFKTGGLSAIDTFEVHMIVVMLMVRAGLGAEGVFHRACIGEHLVDNPFFEKQGKGSVNGHPVKIGAERLFKVGLGQSIAVQGELIQNPGPAVGAADLMVLENMCGIGCHSIKISIHL